MPLDLPDGSVSFVDANILVYHFVAHAELSDECRRYLRRVVAGDITAVSVESVIADAVHKVMAEEARLQHALDRGAIRFLQRHPNEIAKLSAFVEAAKQLEQMPIRLLAVDLIAVREGAELSQKYGLLTNDAIIVVLMQRHGIPHLATNDDDFDRVPGITVWKPR
jgi:predicted nucleic acid-binding protein